MSTRYTISKDKTISVVANNGWEGKPGADGQNATIEVGSTVTLPAGTSATVTNSGTASQAVLNFGIPAGLPGKDGVDGKDGIDGKDGQDGRDGVDGQAATVQASAITVSYDTPASVINEGTPTDARFVFHIPAGVPGSDGATGQAAGFGTPTATVSTLTPGSSATVSVSASGADTSKVFDFTFGIPQGAEGQQGPAGYSPVRGVDYWTAADQAQIVSDVEAQIGDIWEYSQVIMSINPSQGQDSYMITGVKKNGTDLPIGTYVYPFIQMLGADSSSHLISYGSGITPLYVDGQIQMTKSSIDTLIQNNQPDCVECEIVFFKDSTYPGYSTIPLFRTPYPVSNYVDSQIGTINTVLQGI